MRPIVIGHAPPPPGAPAGGAAQREELLTVSAFRLDTAHDWHIKLALMTPDAGWDRHGRFETGRWPLFTLWADDANWIEFAAECGQRAFEVRLCVRGVCAHYGCGPAPWGPGAQLLVALGYDHRARRLYAGASLGGALVRVLPDGIALPPAAPFTLTQLRYRGAPGGGYKGQGTVTDMRVFGGMIDDERALDNAALAGAFEDLSFLT